MTKLQQLRVKIFADGADLDGILKMYANPLIKGFTTNPSLMRKAGLDDYEAFARKVLAAVPDRPVSLAVVADDRDRFRIRRAHRRYGCRSRAAHGEGCEHTQGQTESGIDLGEPPRAAQ